MVDAEIEGCPDLETSGSIAAIKLVARISTKSFERAL